MEELKMEESVEETEAPDRAAELKEARRSFSRIGLGYFIGSIVIFGIQLLAIRLAGKLKPELVQNGDTYMLVSMLPMYLVGMPAIYLLVRRIPVKAPGRHSMKPGHFALALLLAFSVMYILNILGTVITTVIGLFKDSQVQNTVANVVTQTSPFMMVIIMVICAPVIEEIMFRKLIVDRTLRYGQGAAVAVSGLMFGLFHGNLNQFAYATGLGMFLAFLYVKTGKLKITIAIHMFINLMGSVVGSSVLKLLNLDAMLKAQESGEMMKYAMENFAGLMVYLVYAFFIFGVMIAGFVLWIVFMVKKRFTFERGEIVLPRGRRFRTVILNIGMMLYCVLWIGMIIYQLLQ